MNNKLPYWANEIEKARKAIEAVKKSSLDRATKSYLTAILNDEIARCECGIKYIGD